MRDVTISDIDRLDVCAAPRDVALAMDEDGFRVFYEHTSRPLWAYLARLSGSRTDADDLLQETYYRLVRAGMRFGDDTHRRRYLFTIATNLVLDRRRRSLTRPEAPMAGDVDDLPAEDSGVEFPGAPDDVRRAMVRLKPRDRALLWLAYAQGALARRDRGRARLEVGEHPIDAVQGPAEVRGRPRRNTSRWRHPCSGVNARANRNCSTRCGPANGPTGAPRELRGTSKQMRLV